MPPTGKQWRHVVISTHRSWLHGSERGFRSRRHRIHSSGDYTNPPPKAEHEGLREYHLKNVKGKRVEIPASIRQELCAVIVLKFVQLGCRVLVVSVSKKHSHALVELPEDLSEIRQLVGRCKSARSSLVRKVLPGTIWGEGGKYKLVPNADRLTKTFEYIADDQERDARVWTHLEGLPVAPKGFR